MNISKLLQDFPSQTVYRVSDLASLLNKPVASSTIALISYHVRTGTLLRLSKGLYAFTAAYSREELGNKLRTPSYISFTTVLQQAGLIFQPYTTITLAAARSETTEVAGQRFQFRKIKDTILLNTEGLSVVGNVTQATPERALLDWWYLDGEQPLDRPQNISWPRLRELNQKVYHSKRLATYIQKGP